jgi:hypothetical protein
MQVKPKSYAWQLLAFSGRSHNGNYLQRRINPPPGLNCAALAAPLETQKPVADWAVEGLHSDPAGSPHGDGSHGVPWGHCEPCALFAPGQRANSLPWGATSICLCESSSRHKVLRLKRSS